MMGEAKRRRDARSPAEQAAEAVTRKLVDDGLIVEAGFQSLLVLAFDERPTGMQFDQLREAFFAGAQHVFGSIMTMLEPGEEPTEKDYDRMTAIETELKRFIQAYELKHSLTKGSA